MRPVAAIILAAGASTRLGRPKQTVVLQGETLVARAVRIAAEAGLSPVIAVVATAELIDPLQALGATVLLNRKWFEGMASSIHAGIRWATGLDVPGAVLMTCDQVAITPAHLRALCEESEIVTGSAYGGKVGVPAYFPAGSFPALLKLTGDTGARTLLQGARSVPFDDLTIDVDTEADLERARTYLENED